MSKDHTMIKKIGFAMGGVLLVIAIVVLIKIFTEKTHYLKIDNFDMYYHDVPDKTLEYISSALFDTVKKNVDGDVQHKGALIRDTEPYLYTYDSRFNELNGEFVVDIPAIQQSYLVKFAFNEDPEAFMGGYAVLVYCLPEEKMIYPDFNCKDNLPFIKEEE